VNFQNDAPKKEKEANNSFGAKMTEGREAQLHNDASNKIPAEAERILPKRRPKPLVPANLKP
jgi:hypothetical protein